MKTIKLIEAIDLLEYDDDMEIDTVQIGFDLTNYYNKKYGYMLYYIYDEDNKEYKLYPYDEVCICSSIKCNCGRRK